MRCRVEEIFIRWTVEKIIISQILDCFFFYCLFLPSDIEYKLVYI